MSNNCPINSKAELKREIRFLLENMLRHAREADLKHEGTCLFWAKMIEDLRSDLATLEKNGENNANGKE